MDNDDIMFGDYCNLSCVYNLSIVFLLSPIIIYFAIKKLQIIYSNYQSDANIYVKNISYQLILSCILQILSKCMYLIPKNDYAFTTKELINYIDTINLLLMTIHINYSIVNIINQDNFLLKKKHVMKYGIIMAFTMMMIVTIGTIIIYATLEYLLSQILTKICMTISAMTTLGYSWYLLHVFIREINSAIQNDLNNITDIYKKIKKRVIIYYTITTIIYFLVFIIQIVSFLTSDVIRDTVWTQSTLREACVCTCFYIMNICVLLYIYKLKR
jgi:hypothetical protein